MEFSYGDIHKSRFIFAPCVHRGRGDKTYGSLKGLDLFYLFFNILLHCRDFFLGGSEAACLYAEIEFQLRLCAGGADTNPCAIG